MDLDHASMSNDRPAGWLDRLAWQRWKSGGRRFVVVVLETKHNMEDYCCYGIVGGTLKIKLPEWHYY